MKVPKFQSFKVSKKGFTLIELLVVISIIGILAAFGVSRYSVAEKQARDTQRKSDLNQYRVALENYSAANNLAYPILACTNVSNLCSKAVGASTFQGVYFAGSCLQDPRADVTTYYGYCSDGTQYVLWSVLESGGYFEVCSNGKIGKATDIPADSSCPL